MLFNENSRANSEPVSIENITLEQNGDEIELCGSLIYDGENINFVSSGVLSKNEKTENAGISENLILGDMSDFGNFHFVQLRIDKDSSEMSIILQEKTAKN